MQTPKFFTVASSESMLKNHQALWSFNSCTLVFVWRSFEREDCYFNSSVMKMCAVQSHPKPRLKSYVYILTRRRVCLSITDGVFMAHVLLEDLTEVSVVFLLCLGSFSSKCLDLNWYCNCNKYCKWTVYNVVGVMPWCHNVSVKWHRWRPASGSVRVIPVAGAPLDPLGSRVFLSVMSSFSMSPVCDPSVGLRSGRALSH